MKLRDSDYSLTLDQHKCAENLSERKVVFLFSVFYKALYSHIIYIFSILQRTLFTLSSLFGAFDAVLTLSYMERAPSCLPVLLRLTYHPQIGIWQVLTVSG